MVASNWPRPLLFCLLFAATSCSQPESESYASAKQRFAQDRGTYETLLKALTACDFKPDGRDRPEGYPTIHSDAGKNAGNCGGDPVRTSAISASLRKVGAKYVAWSRADGTVDFFYSDEHTAGTKTRTRLAIAYNTQEYQRSSDDDSASPACVIKVRALTSEAPYHWLWVYRFTTADTNIADSEWCDDLRLP